MWTIVCKIYFRLKYGFSYNNSFMLDHAFVNWANKVVKYYLTNKIKLKDVKDEDVEDYQEMLDLIDDLYENYTHSNEKMANKYRKFCRLFKKHSVGLWIDL